MIRAARSALKAHGVAGLAALAVRRMLRRRAACHPLVRTHISDRIGLEVGGPSGIFRSHGLLPVYPLAARVDNCNFSGDTVWEGRIHQGRSFNFDDRREPGYQYIAEATDLAPIAAGAYDFVLSSHTLEHTANPLRALEEFSRVLRQDGLLVVVLPDKRKTFDHRRPVTALAHLVDDYCASRGEDDTTHLDEILALHDLHRDPGVSGGRDFAERCRDNLQNRCVHHHVFDVAVAAGMVGWLGWPVSAIESADPYHIIVVSRKQDLAAPAGEHSPATRPDRC